uniref:Cilia- and flagella-associated protein 97 n=1 Tax=Acanthochromis polyacanthus TaxID=80966 RepID=A0A3Q1EQ09_9TELE
MFNPSELEGEVDHSFFDSDCADSSGDGWKKTEKDFKAEKERRAAHETLNAKHAEHAQGYHSLRTERTRKHLKQVENNNSRRVERKERCRTSSVSSVSGISDKVINDSSESEDDSNLPSKRASGTFMGLLADSRDVDDTDAYNQSPNESEEEALAFKASTKRRYKQSPKKLQRNRCSPSPSPTSSETSADADPESSCSSSSRRSSSSLESPTPSKHNQSSLCPGVRRQSSGSRDVPDIHTEESDDRMTDVSPLSSNDTSPLQSLDLNHREVEKGSQKQEQQQQQESVPSSGLSNRHQDEDSDPDVDDCSLRLESQLESSLVLRCPGGRNRKNYSFTNDEVRRIDRENRRLLRELSRLSPGPRPGSVVGKKTHVGVKSPLIRPSHSALNRQREQQRIERENLAFLKRLESVKPTPGLKRSEQMADYQRHVGYLGAPSYSICRSTTKKDRSSSRTASGRLTFTVLRHIDAFQSFIYTQQKYKRNTFVFAPIFL